MRAEELSGIKRERGLRRIRWSDILIYLLALQCLIALVVLAGRGGIARLAAPSWPYLAAAVLFTFLFMVCMALRYRYVLEFFHRDGTPTFLPILFGTAFGMTAGLIVSRGIGQLVAKPALLKDQEAFPLTKGIHASLVERLMDFSTGVILTLPFLVKMVSKQAPFAGAYLLLWFGLASVWALVAVWRMPFLIRVLHGCLLGLLGLFAGVRFARLREVRDRLASMHIEERRVGWRRPEIVGSVVWSLLKLVIMSGRLFFVSHAFSAPIPWESYLLGVAVVQISMVFAFTPGSLGFLEAGWLAALSVQGASSDSVLTALLGLRAVNYVFFPILTLAIWAAYKRGWPSREERIFPESAAQ